MLNPGLQEAVESVKWTDVGTFIVAAIALVVAGFAAWANYRTNQHQAAQLRRLEDESRSRQAEQRRAIADQVAVWLAFGMHVPALVLTNNSNQPIYDVEIVLGMGPRGKLSVYGPGRDDRAYHAISRSIISLFDSSLDNEVPDRADPRREMVSRRIQRKWIDAGVEISFTDVAGRRWRRAVTGRLDELSLQ